MEIAIINAGHTNQCTCYQFKNLEELQNWCVVNVKTEVVLDAVMKPIRTRRLKIQEEE